MGVIAFLMVSYHGHIAVGEDGAVLSFKGPQRASAFHDFPFAGLSNVRNEVQVVRDLAQQQVDGGILSPL